MTAYPDSKVHEANMGPTWVLSAPDGPHVGPINLAIGVASVHDGSYDVVVESTVNIQLSIQLDICWCHVYTEMDNFMQRFRIYDNIV